MTDPTPTTGLTLSVASGIDLWIEQHGSRERQNGTISTRPTVLLIHGLGSCAADMARQADALAPDYRVITPDLRGHGQSTKRQGPFGITQHARDMGALLDVLASNEPVHVIGVSLGGMIGLQLACDRPGQVQSVVAMNCVSNTRLRSWSRIKAAMLRVSIHLLYGMKGTANLLAPRLFPKPEQEHLREQFRETWCRNDSNSYFRCLLGATGWSVTERLGDLGCPALFIGADRDFVPQKEIEGMAAAVARGQSAWVADAGHAAIAERPDAINDLLVNFLAENCRS